MNTAELVQREVAAALDRQRAEDESHDVRIGIVLAVGVAVILGNLSSPPTTEPAVSLFIASHVNAGLGALVLLALLRPTRLAYPPDARTFARDLDFSPAIDATPFLQTLAIAQLAATELNNTRLRRKLFWLVIGTALTVAAAVLYVLQRTQG